MVCGGEQGQALRQPPSKRAGLAHHYQEIDRDVAEPLCTHLPLLQQEEWSAIKGGWANAEED